MNNYHELLADVLSRGSTKMDRTGVGTIGLFGVGLEFDLTEGFPALTTRKIPWKSAIGEQIGFIRGYTNAADFRALGCKFWDQNANENEAWLNNPARRGTDDLGEIYGYQARKWAAYTWYDGVDFPVINSHDQLGTVLEALRDSPASRRLLVSHWRPDRLSLMALPPCHVMYQFNVDTERNELSLALYMRSNDLFLGAPANIVEYAWLLAVVAEYFGYTAKKLAYFVGDAHIYLNHVDQVKELLTREHKALPKLVMTNLPNKDKEPVRWLEELEPSMFTLEGYDPNPPITAPMAV